MVALSANGRAIAWTEMTLRPGVRVHAVSCADVSTSSPVFLHEREGHDPYDGTPRFDPNDQQLLLRRGESRYLVGDDEDRLAIPGVTSLQSHAFSPDGRLLAVGDVDGSLHVLRYQDHELSRDTVSLPVSLARSRFPPTASTSRAGAPRASS